MTLASLRNEVAAVDATLPIASLQTMEDAISLTLLPQRIAGWLLTLSGGTMDSLATSAGTIYSASTGTNTFRVMLAGTIAAGPVMRFWMPDRRSVALYGATLEQAAVPDAPRRPGPYPGAHPSPRR